MKANKTLLVVGLLTTGLLLNGCGDKQEKHYALYENYLTKNVYAGEIDRNYYAYLDLNNDKIPEMLVTDNKENYELYCIKQNSVMKGDSGTTDEFYLVNGNAILTKSEVGDAVYTTVTENGVQKDAYLISDKDELNRSSRVIGDNYYHKSGLTFNFANNAYKKALDPFASSQEEYAYYINTEKGEIIAEGFVETIEKIEFQENLFRKDLPEVKASEEELMAVFNLAEIFRSDERKTSISEDDIVFATALYGNPFGFQKENIYFEPAKSVYKADYADFYVFNYDEVRNFMRETVGLYYCDYIPAFNGKLESNYVYQKDGLLYVFYDGIGGFEVNAAELVDYSENGEGIATAEFKGTDNRGKAYSAELIVQRNNEGGLQIKEFKKSSK